MRRGIIWLGVSILYRGVLHCYPESIDHGIHLAEVSILIPRCIALLRQGVQTLIRLGSRLHFRTPRILEEFSGKADMILLDKS